VTVNVSTSAAVRTAKEGVNTGVGFTPFVNAYLIMMLPYSIVTISIVTALLPHLSKLAIEKKREEVRDQLIRAIKMVGVLTIPSAVAFMFFGPLITRVLYVGISKADAIYVGQVLAALGLGLVAFSINIILIRGFNAFEDTRTQVPSILLINIIAVGLSYLSLVLLPSQWVTVGLGVAFSISYILGLFFTLVLLDRHTGRIRIRDFLGQHARVLAASAIAMLPLFAISQYFAWANSDSGGLIRFAELAMVMVLGFIGYFFVAHKIGVSEIALSAELAKAQFGRAISSRRKPPVAGGE
jgi:putative peptidoglycan lipid II flippase